MRYLEQIKEGDVVFTFHPGEPVRPSEVETKDIPDGARLSKEQAKELGFDKVKYLSNEMLEQYRSKKTILETSKDETGKLNEKQMSKGREGDVGEVFGFCGEKDMYGSSYYLCEKRV